MITAALAVWGAVLSTVTFALQQRARLVRLKVHVSHAIVAVPGETIDCLSISITNYSEKAVFINGPRLSLLDGKDLIFIQFIEPDLTFPKELKAGQACSATIALSRIWAALSENGYSTQVTVRAAVSDQTGKRFLSGSVNLAA